MTALVLQKMHGLSFAYNLLMLDVRAACAPSHMLGELLYAAAVYLLPGSHDSLPMARDTVAL